jgi:hypothetical protein
LPFHTIYWIGTNPAFIVIVGEKGHRSLVACGMHSERICRGVLDRNVIDCNTIRKFFKGGTESPPGIEYGGSCFSAISPLGNTLKGLLSFGCG